MAETTEQAQQLATRQTHAQLENKSRRGVLETLKHLRTIAPQLKSDAAVRPVPMTPRVRGIIEARWVDAGKPGSGWVFPAKKAKSSRIMDNRVYEPCGNAVTRIKLNPREFVLYALRHTRLTRWGDSGLDVWAIDRTGEMKSVRGGDVSGDNTEIEVLSADTKMLLTATL